MIELRIRVGGRVLLLEVNGRWLALDASKPRAITVEFGRVEVDTLESAERRE